MVRARLARIRDFLAFPVVAAALVLGWLGWSLWLAAVAFAAVLAVAVAVHVLRRERVVS